MQSKSETHETLNAFIHEVGIPYELHSDDAKELMEGKFKQICRDYGIKTTYNEPQARGRTGLRQVSAN